MTTLSQRALEAAWEAYQNTPIDLLADSDEETKRCVANALTAALAVDGLVLVPNGDRLATWTHDDACAAEYGEHLYYFAPTVRRKPPYKQQRHVTAIIDIADDGTLAGVELINDMPPPPLTAVSGNER